MLLISFIFLESVEQAKGMDQIGPNSFEYTMYTSCMNLEKGILYFNCYDDSRISAVDMNKRRFGFIRLSCI